MQLQQVDSYTPLKWFVFEKMGPGMLLHDVLILKAVCSLTQGQNAWTIQPDEKSDSAPIYMSDEPYDFDVGVYASLRIAGDTVFYKPGTDFFLRGHALPFKGYEETWPAQITIISNGREQKQIIVLHGERHWQSSLLKGWHLSKPKPCESIELRYELAYGGSYQKGSNWIRHEFNPVGRGFFPVHRMDKEVFYPAARIERIDNPLRFVDKPIAVPALGPISRPWPSRKRFAGTYDAAWREDLKKNQRADYPPDFDAHFFQVAHPKWIFEPYWRGDESISLVGLLGDKPISGKLPGWAPILQGKGPRGALEPYLMNLDTVEADLDLKLLFLTWRVIINQALQIEHVIIHL